MPEVIVVAPPAALMRPVHRPYYDGATNGDLLRHAQDLEQAVDACNADKEALRRWAAGQGKK